MAAATLPPHCGWLGAEKFRAGKNRRNRPQFIVSAKDFAYQAGETKQRRPPGFTGFCSFGCKLATKKTGSKSWRQRAYEKR
jgi:hypothetical protein